MLGYKITSGFEVLKSCTHFEGAGSLASSYIRIKGRCIDRCVYVRMLPCVI